MNVNNIKQLLRVLGVKDSELIPTNSISSIDKVSILQDGKNKLLEMGVLFDKIMSIFTNGIYEFKGLITPETEIKPKGLEMYITAQSGNYPNIGLRIPTDQIALVIYDGRKWSFVTIRNINSSITNTNSLATCSAVYQVKSALNQLSSKLTQNVLDAINQTSQFGYTNVGILDPDNEYQFDYVDYSEALALMGFIVKEGKYLITTDKNPKEAIYDVPQGYMGLTIIVSEKGAMTEDKRRLWKVYDISAPLRDVLNTFNQRITNLENK